MNRRNQILAALLALQVILAVVALWPRRAATVAGQPLFPGLQGDQVTALTITAGDGKSIRMARGEGSWVLPEAGDYPVLADKVPSLLDKVIALKAERPVATTAASQKQLKVAAAGYERLIEIELADGTRHRLYVGTSPSYGSSHVRADDQAEVYLAAKFSVYDISADASAWVERTYLTVPRDQAVSLKLENKQGRFEFEKQGEQWSLKDLAEGETLDPAKVTDLLSRVSPLSLLRPLGRVEKPEYGLVEPAATLTIVTHSDQGDKTYVLRVGAQDASDRSYAVKSSESPYYVRVSEYSVKDMVERGRDAFLVQPTPPPTPSPEATPGG